MNLKDIFYSVFQLLVWGQNALVFLKTPVKVCGMWQCILVSIRRTIVHFVEWKFLIPSEWVFLLLGWMFEFTNASSFFPANINSTRCPNIAKIYLGISCWNKHLNRIQYVFLVKHISNMNEFVLKLISKGSSTSGGLMLKDLHICLNLLVQKAFIVLQRYV